MKTLNKMNKKIIFILIALILSINSYIYADYKNTGSINFIAINNSNSESVANLTINVYQIGKTTDGNFDINDLYKEFDLNNYNKENIDNIENIALQKDTPVFTKTTDTNGKISFENINLGVYLFVQSNKTEDIQMQTMLVKIPEATENNMNYEITVKPKISVKENNPENNEQILGTKIPYTGILNWPIPVLAISAILILCIAWITIYSKKSKKKIN